MDNFGIAIMILLLLAILLIPIYFCFKGYGFFKLYLIAYPIMAAIIVILAYWPHFYTDIQLLQMGFDSEGLSFEERTKNVQPELHEKAEALYWLGMGVGWPLTAILWLVIFSPYPLVLWFCKLLFNKVMARKRVST